MFWQVLQILYLGLIDFLIVLLMTLDGTITLAEAVSDGFT